MHSCPNALKVVPRLLQPNGPGFETVMTSRLPWRHYANTKYTSSRTFRTGVELVLPPQMDGNSSERSSNPRVTDCKGQRSDIEEIDSSKVGRCKRTAQDTYQNNHPRRNFMLRLSKQSSPPILSVRGYFINHSTIFPRRKAWHHSRQTPPSFLCKAEECDGKQIVPCGVV